MGKQITLNEIISFLNKEIITVYGEVLGKNVKYIKSTQSVDEHSLDWINKRHPDKQRMAESSIAKSILVNDDVVYSDILEEQDKSLIVVHDPQLAIAKIIDNFFVTKNENIIHHTAIIHENAVIGENAYIGPHVVIGNCKIGKNVKILGNSFIYDNVTIGDDVEIHNGVSIGNEAHNFIKDKNGELIKFPHIGQVIIENNVLVGANSVISRGVLENTIIKKGCKIAQHVLIGANNFIGENCAIRSNTTTSGSVNISSNTIIAPSVTIRDHCSIGANCIIGMGAVVTKNVPSNEIWIGNPAKKMKNHG